MKIAIHENGSSFTPRWIAYCKARGLDVELVSAYNSDIIEQLQDCDTFMWHHSQLNYKDRLFANSLLHSLQLSGKRVFPDSNTNWHFDDKVAQKYLFEALQLPLVPTHVFYSHSDALNWIRTTTFPKVLKLRGGAASANVRLVRDQHQARSLARKAFSTGFPQHSSWRGLKERWRKYRLGKASISDVARSIVRLAIPSEFARHSAPEIGYIYFQDFIPDNTFDIRIVVVGNRAFGIKRLVRENDFRASGSGRIVYCRHEIDERCVAIALEASRKMKSQCMGYDFVFDANNAPLIIEMSYGFTASGYDRCEGYWDDNLAWYPSPFNPCGWMIEDLLAE